MLLFQQKQSDVCASVAGSPRQPDFLVVCTMCSAAMSSIAVGRCFILNMVVWSLPSLYHMVTWSQYSVVNVKLSMPVFSVHEIRQEQDCDKMSVVIALLVARYIFIANYWHVELSASFIFFPFFIACSLVRYVLNMVVIREHVVSRQQCIDLRR